MYLYILLLLHMVDQDNNFSNKKIIYFYETFEGNSKPEHRYLNNFYNSPFISESGESFASVEHYYQCHKFGDFTKEGFKDKFESIRKSEDADICKKLSRKYTKEMKPEDWDKENWDNKLKDYYMKRALTFKFSQNKDLLSKLLSTKDYKLIEESKKDAYWGGLIENSLNKLGYMLMELRDNYDKTKTVYLEGSNLDPVKVVL